MATKLTREVRLEKMRQAHVLHLKGKTQRYIAVELDVSQPTVSGWLRRLREPAWTPQRRVAEKIRAEMVCCNIYQRLEDLYIKDSDSPEWKELRHSNDYHPICYFGEWAARIAEKTPAS